LEGNIEVTKLTDKHIAKKMILDDFPEVKYCQEIKAFTRRICEKLELQDVNEEKKAQEWNKQVFFELPFT